MLITLSSSCVIISLSMFPTHLHCHHRHPPLEIFSSNDARHLLCSREETVKHHSLSLAGTMAALTIKKSHLTFPLSLKAHPAMLKETTMMGHCGHGLLASQDGCQEDSRVHVTRCVCLQQIMFGVLTEWSHSTRSVKFVQT